MIKPSTETSSIIIWIGLALIFRTSAEKKLTNSGNEKNKVTVRLNSIEYPA